MGLKAGAPDLCLIYGGRFIGLEGGDEGVASYGTATAVGTMTRPTTELDACSPAALIGFSGLLARYATNVFK
jgi:hypothetical protein